MNPIVSGDPLQIDQYPQHVLGTLLTLPDGRKYRYAQAGGSNLAVGKLGQGAAELTNHANMALGADVAIGGQSLSVTPGATAGAANLYSEGYASINAGTGLGHMYKVASNPAITASTAFTFKLAVPVKVALDDADTKVTLIPNPWKNVIVYPTTATGGAVGVAPVAVTASYYYWAQTGGVGTVLCDGNWTVGSRLSPSNGTAGAVENGVEAQGFVGVALTTGRTGEYMPILLTID